MISANQGMNDSHEFKPGDYTGLLASVMIRVRSVQYAALIAVIIELFGLYCTGILAG